MDDANARAEEQAGGPQTPEDVAILYSWANLPGAKYRDFSASRREYRAQQRARAAEAQRESELEAARQLELAAKREVEEAQRQVEETLRAEAQAVADAKRKQQAEEALRLAEERAEQERLEVARRQQSAEDLRVQAERAHAEMLEARKRAEDQAARYAEFDAQYHSRLDRESPLVPGETTDPYYYTGHVDPAYFASTPGVRTAQTARVSTERKAYIYPMHPGSEEFDAGTIVNYRQAENNFAPSPAQEFARGASPTRDPFDRARPQESERTRPIRFSEEPEEAVTAGMDDAYYNGGPTRRMFAPSPQAEYTTTRETAAGDLHIRPATRTSDTGQENYAPAGRITPLPQIGTPPRRTVLTEQLAPPESIVTRPESSATWAETDLTEERPALTLPEVGSAQVRIVDVEPDLGRLTPIQFEASPEDDSKDDHRASRMFIPSPRRRVLGAPRPFDHASQTREVVPANWRVRDAAAALGEEESRAEVAARRAQDLFVARQEAAVHLPPVGVLATKREIEQAAAASQAEQPSSAGRSAEAGTRRRRDQSPELAVRTVRQQRLTREEPTPEQTTNTEPEATQPAWLSTERPAATRPATPEVKSKQTTDLPHNYGDPTVPVPRAVPRTAAQASGMRLRGSTPASTPASEEKQVSEQWRGAADLRPAQNEDASSDTLQQSRERVASRWFALSGLMGSEERRRPDTRSTPRPAPMLSVLSISGGVGKTSIVATLGRALSSVGEKVLLVDTHVHGILPYYFGAREQRPGSARTFTPPAGSADAPVSLVSYDAETRAHDDAGQARVLDDLQRRSQETQRVLLDVGVNSAWLARKVSHANPWILVPVAPDMNSVIGTQAVERLFQDMTDADGRAVKPYYILNQYDPTLPLHLDVREVLRKYLGDRLLPIMLHRTPALSEALAEGMTVIDYAPGSTIADDYMNLATWVRHLAEPGVTHARPTRWSEG